MIILGVLVMKNHPPNNNNGFFSIETVNNIMILTFNGDVLLPLSYLTNKELLFNYLDIYSKNDSITAIIIRYKRKRSPVEEYFQFYNLLSESKIDTGTLLRMYRAYDQFILKIIQSNKFFISACRGDMISQDFHVDLTCDYKIIADDTLIHKPYLELGLIPKGGGAYFLKSKLGHSRAYQLLLSKEVITAPEALRLGIVNEVIPKQEFENSTLKIAERITQRPVTSLSGIKRLLNHRLNDLENYLELENQILINILSGSSRNIVTNLGTIGGI